MRSIIHVLSKELFGRSLALPEFPSRPSITGAGLSDWETYAVVLADRFGYRNTYYHQEPRLDILHIESSLEGTLDFLIASDVFEHVGPPVSSAFANARRLLRPGGLLVFTVPYAVGIDQDTIEHFPNLHAYHLANGPDGKPVLVNATRDGQQQTFTDLVFHGGAGFALEMRLFSEEGLLREFRDAGFRDVKIHGEDDPAHGIYWSGPCSLPISARA